MSTLSTTIHTPQIEISQTYQLFYTETDLQILLISYRKIYVDNCHSNCSFLSSLCMKKEWHTKKKPTTTKNKYKKKPKNTNKTPQSKTNKQKNPIELHNLKCTSRRSTELGKRSVPILFFFFASTITVQMPRV